jgi:hypothetical protein
MTYRVVWLNRAIGQLAVIYRACLQLGAGADAVVRASAMVDQLLAPNPTAVGESRAGNERVLIEPPLTIYCEVHDDERVVVVTSVVYPARGTR